MEQHSACDKTTGAKGFAPDALQQQGLALPT
jgi:hypothetical protein